jgi:hypothetical protein
LFLGDLCQAHAGAVVDDNLLPIHIQPRTTDLPPLAGLDSSGDRQYSR